MAQKVSVELVDDLDGKAADETVTFALDSIGYEIDLSNKNAAKLRDALGAYIAAARRTGKTAGSKSSTKAKTGPSAKEIREWAKANGHEVPDRGRVPAEVTAAYEAAN